MPSTHQPVHGSNPVKPLRATPPRPLTSHGHNDHGHTAIPDLAGSCGYDALLDFGPGRTSRPARRAWRTGSRMILTDQRARQSGCEASCSTRWRKMAAHSSLAGPDWARARSRVSQKMVALTNTHYSRARHHPSLGLEFDSLVRERTFISRTGQVVEVRGERGIEGSRVGPGWSRPRRPRSAHVSRCPCAANRYFFRRDRPEILDKSDNSTRLPAICFPPSRITRRPDLDPAKSPSEMMNTSGHQETILPRTVSRPLIAAGFRDTPAVADVGGPLQPLT